MLFSNLMVARENNYPTTKNRPFILAHRGASAFAPENSLEAMQKAVELGFDGVEFDVCMSSDGVPVIIHDETVDRTTSGSGPVKDMTAAELKSLGVPSLEEVLDSLAPNMIANVELKYHGNFKKEEYLARVFKILSNYNKNKKNLKIVISSFEWEFLRIAREKSDKAILGLLVKKDNLNLKDLSLIKKIRPDALHLKHSYAPKFITKYFKSKNLPIVVWTVDDLSKAERLRAAGVAGIISNKLAKI